ncbi:MAG TPA: hypothetical protein VIO32_01180 [Candidatus Baltobacteraceae bacterium]
MNVHKIALAGALLAFATPLAALAQSAPQAAPTLTTVLNTLSQNDRAQVRNILALLESKQLDSETAATQIDSFLTDNESKSVLALAPKDANQSDAGEYIVTLAQPSK